MLGVPESQKNTDSHFAWTIKPKFSEIGSKLFSFRQCLGDAVCVWRRRKIKTGLDFDWSRGGSGSSSFGWFYKTERRKFSLIIVKDICEKCNCQKCVIVRNVTNHKLLCKPSLVMSCHATIATVRHVMSNNIFIVTYEQINQLLPPKKKQFKVDMLKIF